MVKTKVLAFVFLFLFGASSTANADIILLQPGDFVGSTFWLISIGMLAATIFLLIERGTVAASWKRSVTVAATITGVSFFHYIYLRGMWAQTGDAPTLYRYVDWIITFPLLVIEFYLILSAVRKVSTLIFWRLLAASLVMTMALYLGEAGYLQSFIAFVIGIIGWIFILFELYSGESSRIIKRIGNKPLVAAFNSMRIIVTVGWAIYPLGYIFGYLAGDVESSTLNIIYNLADFVNKITFGLIIWSAATNNTYLSRH